MNYFVLSMCLLAWHPLCHSSYQPWSGQSIKYSIKVDKVINYAMSFIGVPYKWQGDSPLTGFDCSGFIMEVMRSVGRAPSVDLSAQGLFDYYSKHGRSISRNRPRVGSLVFFGDNYKNITHVAMALDPYRIIEAGGGDITVRTKEQAIKANAFVRVRAITYRADRVAVIHPDYTAIGLVY